MIIERLPAPSRKWLNDKDGSAVEVIVALQSKPDEPGRAASVIILPLIDKDAPFRVLRRRIISGVSGVMEGAY